MSVINDIVRNANDESCVSNARKANNYADAWLGIGHSRVQAQKKTDLEVLTTIKKGNGIAQPTKWYEDEPHFDCTIPQKIHYQTYSKINQDALL